MLYFMTWADRVSAIVDAASPEAARARACESDAELSADALVVVRELPAGVLVLDVEWNHDGAELALVPDAVTAAAILRLEDQGERACEAAASKVRALCGARLEDVDGAVLVCSEPIGHDGDHACEVDGTRSEWGS